VKRSLAIAGRRKHIKTLQIRQRVLKEEIRRLEGVVSRVDRKKINLRAVSPEVVNDMKKRLIHVEAEIERHIEILEDQLDEDKSENTELSEE
jgi:hypothetical protein